MKLGAVALAVCPVLAAESLIEVRCSRHGVSHVVDLDDPKLRESLDPILDAQGQHGFGRRMKAYLDSLPRGVDAPAWLVAPAGAKVIEVDQARPIVLVRGRAEFNTTTRYQTTGTPTEAVAHYRRLATKLGYPILDAGWDKGTEGISGETRSIRFRNRTKSIRVDVVAEQKQSGTETLVSYHEQRVGPYRPAPEPKLAPETFDGAAGKLFVYDRTDRSRFSIDHEVIAAIDQNRPLPKLAPASMPSWLTGPPGAQQTVSAGGAGLNSADFETDLSPAEVITFYKALFAKSRVAISGEERRVDEEDDTPVLGLSGRDPGTGGHVSIQASVSDEGTLVSVQYYDFAAMRRR